jgi:hypothetical protein
VHVLDDDDRQRPRLAQLGKERVEELLPGRVCPAQRVQAAVDLLRDVEERTQRPGREHAVTGARQKARVGQVVRELLQQARLAYTRLAFEQDEPAFTAARLPRKFSQCVQRSPPLK